MPTIYSSVTFYTERTLPAYPPQGEFVLPSFSSAIYIGRLYANKNFQKSLMYSVPRHYC